LRNQSFYFLWPACVKSAAVTCYGNGCGPANPTGGGVIGALVLILYGIIPTFQLSHFGRVYAASGGVFVILSLVWGNYVDGIRPDRYDVIGAMICVIGVGIIMYWPRQ
jgi:drug/metabolite transporter superfamily protein YnfA